MKISFLFLIGINLFSSIFSQQVLNNIQFECRERLDGFWRDSRYCDVFHACLAGEQRRTYGCPQVGERFFFNEQTQRCEFSASNQGGCQSNQYFQQITNATNPSSSQLTTQAPSEQWRIFVQSREQFNCANQADGFYASRWCNVYYRCFSGISNVFLCPLQAGGGRLWWIQHGLSQVIPESGAFCAFPCETGRRCSSPGGILVDNGNQISESQQEAETIYQRSSCSNQTSSSSSSSSGTNSGQGQTSGGQFGSGQSTNAPCAPGGSCGSGSGQNSGSGGLITVDSDVSCANRADGTFVGSRYCNVYHRCISGSRSDFRCARATNTPYDLWWNPQTNLCDWPCRVQCNNQIYGSSSSAQQIQSESLRFFNNDCRAYPIYFH